MHTVEPCGPVGSNLFELVFYSASEVLTRDGGCEPHRRVLHTGLDQSVAYQLCNYLNGGNGQAYPFPLPR